MFSSVAARLHSDTNPLYKLRDQLREQGRPILDLVSGNVNELGIVFPPELLVEILKEACGRSTVYKPDSFGRRSARQAISGYYREQGLDIPDDRLLLTPGTSIAYWYSFKLLADEGDEILTPSPSYPLFEYIAALSGVRLVPYRMDESRGWAIDLDHLEGILSNRTRALVLISPHNPTGHVSGLEEIGSLADIALRHDLAIISDEVFSEFLMDRSILPRPAPAVAPLVLTLNGFSKMFALPGLKLGWMAVTGDPGHAARAMRSLELISDTFLPVNEIVQAAVPDVFARGRGFLASYVQEVRERWECAQSILARACRCSCVPAGGGFYVALKLDGQDEESLSQAILREAGLLVHPGHFYDMAPNHLVLSFVHPPGVLRDELPRLLEIIRRHED